MINVDLQQLIRALDAPSRRDLEQAAERCVARGGAQVLVEDLLLGLLERNDGLLLRALRDAGVEPDELAATLRPHSAREETRNPVFCAALVQWLQDALMLATLELGQQHIDQGALLLALLRNPLQHAGTSYQPVLARLNTERLLDFSRTQTERVSPGSDSALRQFTHNLTERARAGRLDPVLCRDDALRQMLDILARRRKNNPILVGEAGVGKTALAEGLALRIVQGQVPPALRGVEFLCLDLGLLQAGASLKGEFERRLQAVISEVSGAPTPIILFIDEAHTLIGAGAQAGGGDAANLLKPALARGELRTIAATTWREYKQYFEKDPALARRFQAIHVHEPCIADATTILRGLAPVYAASHGVYLRDDAVQAAAELSARYLAGCQLPDKAVDVLDTACARVCTSLATPPETLEALRTRLAAAQRQLDAQQRDLMAGLSVDPEALRGMEQQLEQLAKDEHELTERWERQSRLASRLLELRRQYAQAPSEENRTALAAAQVELSEAQAEAALVSHEVGPRQVAEVISHWTGIPVTQLAREHSARIARFADDLRQRIRGQEPAVQALDGAMRASAAGLNPPEAPAGVFLLVGPSGVGKTETALALADLLYGGERFLTTINLSEFQERHTVSQLIGAPPGYVGYGEGGRLTEAVRQKPYSVVLLDEVEKAHPDVLNLFYHIFDKGVANDGEGREINFRNCVFLLTSNLASERIAELCTETQPDAQALEEAIRPALVRHFKPALLARMKVVPYYPLSAALLRELIMLKLARFGERLAARQIRFSHCPTLVEHLAERCTHGDSGARLIDQLIAHHLQPLVVDRLLDGLAAGTPLKQVHIGVDSEGGLACECL